MKTKLIALLTVLVIAFNLMGATAFAEASLIPISGAVLNDQLSFKLNGASVIPVGDDGTPVLPISYNGTTYLPLKAIGYLLGLGINYESATKTVLITSGSSNKAPSPSGITKSNKLIPISKTVLNNELKFKLDNKAAIPVGDDGTAVLPISYNGTTYLPIKAIGYLLGLGVGFDTSTKTVQITKGDSTPQPTTSTTTNSQGPGWYFVKYSFKDGSATYGSDVSSFIGEKNNMTMTHNRYDSKGSLIAGSTHQTIWTDPPSVLKVGDVISVQYETKQVSSKTWTMASVQQQSINMDQGMGVIFVAADGTKYITKDIASTMTASKAVEKGAKGRQRVIQFIIGRNYSVTYTYEWRD